MTTVFLDTNVILDYLENRDDKVRHLVEGIIRSGEIRVVTSIFNLIEIIDKEKDIMTIGKLLLNRYSFDEISKMRGERPLSDGEKNIIANKINQFVKDIDEEIYALNQEGYNDAMELTQEFNLQSQDALIVATYFIVEEGCDYFLSNDGNLIKELKEYDICECFNVKADIQDLEILLFGSENTL